MFNDLEKRCVDISYRRKLTHVSSVINTVNTINDIYGIRKSDDPFVLGNSHASLALFVVLEKYGICDAEEMVSRHGTHASRDMEHGVWVSGGSLGQADTVAIGLAMADPERTVWLVTSDGACAEGAVYEAMRLSPPNLNAFVIFNGFGAYGRIYPHDISDQWQRITVDVSRYPQWLRELPGHYLTLTEEQHEELMR